MHQSLAPVPGPTVLTWYHALGDVPGGREQLLRRPWSHWRDAVLAELGAAHPDLAAKTLRIDITRYGHAMAVPVPGVLNQIRLQRSSIQRKQLSKSEYSDALIWPDAPQMAFKEVTPIGSDLRIRAIVAGHERF